MLIIMLHAITWTELKAKFANSINVVVIKCPQAKVNTLSIYILKAFFVFLKKAIEPCDRELL